MMGPPSFAKFPVTTALPSIPQATKADHAIWCHLEQQSGDAEFGYSEVGRSWNEAMINRFPFFAVDDTVIVCGTDVPVLGASTSCLLVAHSNPRQVTTSSKFNDDRIYTYIWCRVKIPLRLRSWTDANGDSQKLPRCDLQTMWGVKQYHRHTPIRCRIPGMS
ncbi:hypothetical protein AB1N83_001599 [Pleurotus pulmonarius]